MSDTAVSPSAGWTPVQRKLLFFLSVATFFEGFDFIALAQVLPRISSPQEFGLSEAQVGWLLGCINVGPWVAWALVRQADVRGRRPILQFSVLGYAVCALLSGFASSAVMFAVLQLMARACLIAEWAVAMIYAAEEFPADRRGRVLGWINACSSIGALVCAGIAPIVLHSAAGWRGLFWLGGVPLLVVAFLRRNLPETQRFVEAASRGSALASTGSERLWGTRWAGRVAALAAIWMLTYACTSPSVLLWKQFAQTERGFSDSDVSWSLTVAAIVSAPLLLTVGPLIDRWGRRRSSLLIFVAVSLSVAGSYLLHSPVALTLALAGGIWSTSAVLPLLNAFTTELFPTSVRAQAFAWSNNLLGRIGGIASPIVVGHLAPQMGWGRAMASTTVFPLLALGLIWWLLPETAARELESTSQREPSTSTVGPG